MRRFLCFIGIHVSLYRNEVTYLKSRGKIIDVVKFCPHCSKGRKVIASCTIQAWGDP